MRSAVWQDASLRTTVPNAGSYIGTMDERAKRLANIVDSRFLRLWRSIESVPVFPDPRPALPGV